MCLAAIGINKKAPNHSLVNNLILLTSEQFEAFNAATFRATYIKPLGLSYCFLMRYSADRACPSSCSPRARTEAILPSSDAPSGEHIISDERFWKSYTPSGDEKRAVPDVGKTWFGPAQ